MKNSKKTTNIPILRFWDKQGQLCYSHRWRDALSEAEGLAPTWQSEELLLDPSNSSTSSWGEGTICFPERQYPNNLIRFHHMLAQSSQGPSCSVVERIKGKPSTDTASIPQSLGTAGRATTSPRQADPGPPLSGTEGNKAKHTRGPSEHIQLQHKPKKAATKLKTNSPGAQTEMGALGWT